VTLTNGLGGSTDWLALTEASIADTPGNFLTWIYVGAGVTTRTWTVNMPTTPGQYQFRLYLNDGYVRAAASPLVTVQAATSTTLAPSTTTSGTTSTVSLPPVGRAAFGSALT
jgi:hypothetical protein